MGRISTLAVRRRLDWRALGIAVLLAVLLAHPAAAQSLWENLLLGVELLIGDSVAQSVVEEYGRPVRLSRGEQEFLDRVFAGIVAQAGRKEIPYSLTVLGSDVVNAFAAPGGRIFVTTGMLQLIGGDVDALASVLGHEVAHVEHKHGMNALSRQIGIGLLLDIALGGASDTIQTAVAVMMELTKLGWSREQEHESDALGQQLAAAAGYDPEGMVRFFERLRAVQNEEPRFLEFLSTHPLTSDRLERAKARAGSLQPAVQSSAVSSAAATAVAGEAPPGGVAAPGGAQAGGISGAEAPGAEQSAPGAGTGAAGGGSVGRVITRGTAQSPAPGPLFEDPAQRFSIRLPAGWAAEPRYYWDSVEFTGPEGDFLWVVTELREPEDSDSLAAARRILARYGEYLEGLAVTSGPSPATLGGLPAAYAEYRYTSYLGDAYREGAYFLLADEGVYLLQYAASPQEFDVRKERLHGAAATFVPGPTATGYVSPEALAASATTAVDFRGYFSMDVSVLWPVTYEPPEDAADDPHVVELGEVGLNGFLNAYVYEVWEGARAVDTAHEWAEYLLEAVPGSYIVEGVTPRSINGREAASFLVGWEDDQGRWLQYSTTMVAGGRSYEIGILYLADGFEARRPVFERWLASWRP